MEYKRLLQGEFKVDLEFEVFVEAWTSDNGHSLTISAVHRNVQKAMEVFNKYDLRQE